MRRLLLESQPLNISSFMIQLVSLHGPYDVEVFLHGLKKHQDKNNIFIFVFLNKDRFNETRIVLLSMALLYIFVTFYKLQYVCKKDR